MSQSNSPLSVSLPHPAATGSRREARTEAILRATLEELAEVGYSALSIEAVAVRVGIAKTTVYRRYPTKLELVRAAIEQYLAEALGEPPNTGSLRGDLIAVGLQLVRLFSSVVGQSLLRTRMLERVEPELEQMGQGFDCARNARNAAIVERAVERGELVKNVDFAALEQLLSGAILVKVVLKREPIDELTVTRLVDVLLHGVSTVPGRHRGGSSR